MMFALRPSGTPHPAAPDEGDAKLFEAFESCRVDGRGHVNAQRFRALLDKTSGRPLRVTAEVVTPFLMDVA